MNEPAVAPPKAPVLVEPADYGKPRAGWRRSLYALIFEIDTPAARAFDMTLVVIILSSVAVVMMDSVASMHAAHSLLFGTLEWLFTLVFTLEYVARLVCVERPAAYARSGFGVIDLLALLPSYLAILANPLQLFIDVRVLRLLRIFRILKLSTYFGEYKALTDAMLASRRKIAVFLSIVLLVALVLGTVMYVVEGPAHGYTSIPVSMYWAVATMTTVGYGDIVPTTDLGRLVASVIMLLGWGTLAVPTGIVSAEFTAQRIEEHDAHMIAASGRVCPACGAVEHQPRARYCHQCGAALPDLPA